MNPFERLMMHALDAARRGVAAGQSPFGAAIGTPDGTLIHAAHNVVRLTCDATAHAEINAIRGACRQLGSISLEGCVMATTCEPCPMCAAAIHWARLDAVAYGATIADAAQAGFNELSLPCESLYRQGQSPVTVHADILRPECRATFDLWQSGPNPTPY